MIPYAKTQLGFVQNVTTNSIAEDSRLKKYLTDSTMDYAITINFNTSEITALTQTRGGEDLNQGHSGLKKKKKKKEGPGTRAIHHLHHTNSFSVCVCVEREIEITMGNNGGFKSDNSTAIGQSVRNLWRNLD